MIIIIIAFNAEWSTVTQKFGGFHVFFSSLGQSTYSPVVLIIRFVLIIFLDCFWLYFTVYHECFYLN